MSTGSTSQPIKKDFFRGEPAGFVRRVLLSTAARFSGPDRQVLIRLYHELGFYSKDLKDLESWAWWKRLAAVIRIERLRMPESVGHLLKRIEDPHELVAVASMRAVSAIPFPGRAQKMLDALSRRAPNRRDIFIEILANLGWQHADEIIEYLQTCFDPYVASLCIGVLGQLKVQRASSLVAEFLRSSDDDVALSAVQALRQLQATDQIYSLQALTEHPSAKLRAAALVALVDLGDIEFSGILSRLKQDQNIDVQRAVFYASHGGSV